MIQVKAIVEAQDVGHLADNLIEEPTVAIYKSVSVNAGGSPLLRMTITQTNQLIEDLKMAVEDLGNTNFD